MSNIDHLKSPYNRSYFLLNLLSFNIYFYFFPEHFNNKKINHVHDFVNFILYVWRISIKKLIVVIHPTLLRSVNHNYNAVSVSSFFNIALVAQWIEHQTSNLGVAGSSPAGGSFRAFQKSKGLISFFFFFKSSGCCEYFFFFKDCK